MVCFFVCGVLDVTCSMNASSLVVSAGSSWPSKLRFSIGMSLQSALILLVCVLTTVEGMHVKGITFITPPKPWWWYSTIFPIESIASPSKEWWR